MARRLELVTGGGHFRLHVLSNEERLGLIVLVQLCHLMSSGVRPGYRPSYLVS